MTLVLTSLFVLITAVGGFGLVSLNQRQIAHRCADAGVFPRPLVRVRDAIRAYAFGACAALGLGAEACGYELVAVAFCVVAMLLTTYRRVPLALENRGVGVWLPLRDADAFESFDWRAFAKHAAPIALASVSLTLMTLVLFGIGMKSISCVIANQAIFVPIALTGLRRQCSPTLWGAARHHLASVYKSLKRNRAVRAVPIAYIQTNCSIPDELRIAVRPINACAGFVAIEVGTACVRDRVGVAFIRDAIVRLHEGTKAAEAMRTLSPGARPMPGRDESEVAFALSLAALEGHAIDKQLAHLCSKFAAPVADSVCAEMPDTRRGLARVLRIVAGEIRRWSGYKIALHSSGTSHARFSSANSP